MRRRLNILVLILILVFILSACNNDNSNAKLDKNHISSADLTQKEEAIFATTSNHSFMFDFRIDEKYDAMSVQIEKYKKGELIDEQLTQLSSDVAEAEGTIIVTTEKQNSDKNHLVFNIGISSGGSTGSLNFLDDELDDASRIAGTFQESDISIADGEAVVAGLVTLKNDDSSITFRTNFYEDSREMKKYDEVYLIKVTPIESTS